jgi:hypothetical protein
MTVHYRGHDVVDPDHRLIGTISDVLYDTAGDRRMPSSWR